MKYSQIITADFKITRYVLNFSTKIIGGVSEYELVITRGDDNYSLSGLFSKSKSVFT